MFYVKISQMDECVRRETDGSRRRQHMDYEDQFRLILLNYYVVFEVEELEEDYRPIVQAERRLGSGTAHLWDTELNGIIPALWYILHLPRMGFDVVSMDIDLVLSGHDEPHNIIPFPYCRNAGEKQRIYNGLIRDATLIICEDKLYDTLKKDPDIPESLLGLVKISQLTSGLLKEHWNRICKHITTYVKEFEPCSAENEICLTGREERGILPLIPLANQFGFLERVFSKMQEFQDIKRCNYFSIFMHKRILELAQEIGNKEEEYGRLLEKLIRENSNFYGMPLVITMPGTMSHQIRFMGRSMELPENEEEVVKILGYHRALAKNAMYIHLDAFPQEMYLELAKLEEHCKHAAEHQNIRRVDNRFVWRTLRRLGKLFNNSLKPFDINILNHVSQITVFSDFPIGVAVLPGCSAPLCCVKPITLRPLTPLTKAFQYEMQKGSQIYLGSRCKVLVAECVERTDGIRPYCDELTAALRDMIGKAGDMELIFMEISSVKGFKEMLAMHPDADILLVSSHGFYDIGSNMAGLSIGGERWMVDDDIHVPRVVLLSACHVTPRGRGVVSAGDLFIRAGARAVLGTFVPVDVRRNAVLIARLFTEIIEVRKGWSNMRTLDDIWSHVVSTNAVHEITASQSTHPSRLEIWANTKNASGSFPIAEFKQKASVGRLRAAHIYEDSEKILMELADRDGMGEYFDSVMKSSGYFPESVFYQFTGCPENIFVRNDIIKEYSQKSVLP